MSPSNDPFEADQPVAPLPDESALALPSTVLPMGQSARQIRTHYVTAMSVPRKRDMAEVERDFLLECAQLGARAYYSWGVSGEKGAKDLVEGPSINLALALARCFGDCVVEPLPVESDDEAWYFRYAFIDLQRGFTIIRPFRQSRAWRVYGRFDDERKEDIRFQIGASKAMRNVTLNALPEWLIQKGMERAKQGERARIEAYVKKNGLEAAQTAMLESLAEVGATAGRVLARMGRATTAALTIEDLVRLRGDLKALQLGQELVDHLFPLEELPKADDPDDAEEETGATAQAKRTLRRRAAQVPPEPPAADAGAEAEARTGEEGGDALPRDPR